MATSSGTGDDPHALQRFLDAQDDALDGSRYETAIAELHGGRKRSHWVWYVFPQLIGLGRSALATRYGLNGVDEAGASARHPVLGPRLRDAIGAVLAHEHTGVSVVLGGDEVKFQSCLTLFEAAVPDEPLFGEALDRCFGGRRDEGTLRRVHPS
jgi:uncharacterized protein (DUF1810 family)